MKKIIIFVTVVALLLLATTTYAEDACVEDTWTCGDWSACSESSTQNRSCTITSDCPTIETASPVITQSCIYIPTCTNNDYSCSNWSNCSVNGIQARTCNKTTNCEGGVLSPVTTQSCTYIPQPNIFSINPSTIHLGDQVEIIGENFGSSQPTDCPALPTPPGVACGLLDGNNQPQKIVSWSDTKIIAIIDNTEVLDPVRYPGHLAVIRAVLHKFVTNNDNTREGKSGYITVLAPACSSDTWSCGDWGQCSSYGGQSRTCTRTFDCPTVNTPSPATSQSCTPPCSSDTWSCGNWTTCSSNGSQTRVCNKTQECLIADTPSPTSVQNCVPPQPACTADTWTCGSWGACSLSGIQNRSCSKTYDCPVAETAPPTTDQFCEAPNRPQQIAPSESEEITNQDTIIKATVKLLCPVDEQKASQGSGTVIDSAGTILTNKHVIAGTLGCLVGFVDNFSDEPYFGDRQIADIVKVSSNQDIAVLKIRNPKNKALPYVNTTNGNVNFALGTKITTYGYPAKFGTKVTYTSGDFSGNDGGYLKTTAILEYGNSGGGAYLKNGTYIGIPSAVVKGELNALGYILSINTIRAWLNNSTVASSDTNNNYSRVSVLEDIDLKKLGSLKLFIPNVDKNSNIVAPTTNQNTQKTTGQSQVAPQPESVVIEQNTSSTQNASTTPEQQPQKISLIKRFLLWLSNLFSKLATQ